MTKKYSTLTLLFAAQVIDGARKVAEVPIDFRADVTELIQPLAGAEDALKNEATTSKTPQPATAPETSTTTDPNRVNVPVKPEDK